MYDGFSYRFTPIKNSIKAFDLGVVDTDDLYHKLTETFKFDAVAGDDYLIDYQNMYTFLGVMSLRNLFISSASAFLKEGENERAEHVLDMCRKIMRPDRYPYDNSLLEKPETIADPEDGVSEEGFKPKSPGMKYKHYSPKAEVRLIEGGKQEFRDKAKQRGHRLNSESWTGRATT